MLSASPRVERSPASSATRPPDERRSGGRARLGAGMLQALMRGSNIRLIVSLIVASTLGAALLYTTVLGGTVDVVQVRQVLAQKAKTGEVRLNGTVVSHEGDAA